MISDCRGNGTRSDETVENLLSTTVLATFWAVCLALLVALSTDC